MKAATCQFLLATFTLCHLAAAQFQVPDCNNAAFAPESLGSGQFITGPCTADAECTTNCCGFNSKVCRAPLSLDGNPREFCHTGFTAVFNADRTCENLAEAIPGGGGQVTPPPTPFPTPSPTPFPTPSPTPFPTPEPVGGGDEEQNTGGSANSSTTRVSNLFVILFGLWISVTVNL